MAAPKKKSWPNVGSVRKSPESGNLYLSFKLAEPLTMVALVYREGGEVKEKVTLYPNDKGYVTMMLKDPELEIDALVANEIISEEQGESRKAKLPEALKYNIIAPLDD